MKLKLSEVITIAVILCILAWILWPEAWRRHGGARRAACLSTIKQVQLALLMYSREHDSILPFRDHWMDAAEPHLKEGGDWRCREVVYQELPGFGHAFNSLLDRRKHSSIEEPAVVPMVYDSINYSRNASDPVVSLPAKGRHKGSNVIGFADGHVRRVAVAKSEP